MKTLSDSEIIDALGGTAVVARLCRIKQPSVSGWRVMGIPAARRQFLELLRPDIFGASPSLPSLPAPTFSSSGRGGLSQRTTLEAAA